MPLSQDDRTIFSLKIVSVDTEVAGIESAKVLLQSKIVNIQKLDDANKNLFTPVDTLVQGYQNEYQYIDGNQRTTITEQDILNSANKKFQNHFFPNDPQTAVPSLSASNNVWTQPQPFALTYALGKNYTEDYGSVSNENSLIATALGYITDAGMYTDIQNTTGQQCTTVMLTDTIADYPAIHTLKDNLVSAINDLITALTSEVAAIITNDSNTSRQTQNDTAIDYINNTILPALNTWIAYPDFNTAHGETTCSGFNSHNPATLAPTKLHSTELTALQTALNDRSTFLTTRTSQLDTNLGTIVQDVSTGDITSSSGLYGQRYGFLSLRLNSFGGSLIQLVSLENSITAQEQVKTNLLQTKSTYYSILPTSLFQAPASGTPIIHLKDTSFLSVGDLVYIKAEKQNELLRSIKSVNGNTVTLNDSIPAKYRPNEHARLYKDLT